MEKPAAAPTRAIVITGASSGIGAATAIACARDGWDVLLNGRRIELLEKVAAEVCDFGRRAEIVAGDVTEAAISGRMLDVAEQKLGGFQAVFANAGYGFRKPMHEVTPAELHEIFEVNFFAATELLCEAARRLIARRQRGHLLMCSSAMAKVPLPDYAPYSATKAAQSHVCRAMRMELRQFGIEVSCVHPVTTRTDFFRESARRSGLTPGWADELGGAPSWMIQDAERVADAVVRCLRRPKPEVWTNHVVPFGAAVFTIFPRLLDLAVGGRASRSDARTP